ncbi:MAG: inositol monophosphatase [Microbacterium sp.]|jgi:fructose-1,6-bisphosphatase/inositol monophosphatase family enzyme/glycerophosphoryl diester phosphodiesterase|nr:inositol monophosphatase [Microbacterium sp.]
MTVTALTRCTAHRGDSSAHRENTLPAIRSAIAKGADLVEFDLRLTADGDVIVLHDPTLERLWGVRRPVSETTLAEILALGDADHRPPTLAEALACFDGTDTVAVIDVTDPRMIAPAMPLVLASGATASWCGDLGAMRVVRDLDPDASIWMPWDRVVPPGADEILGLAPDTINVPAYVVTRELVDGVHDLGLRLAAWTVDEPADMRAMAEAGVDQVTTNRLDDLQRVVAGGGDEMTEQSLYARERRVAEALGDWAIEFTRSADPGVIRTKRDDADIVTDVDVAVEKYVREVIGAQFPEHDFVGEEMGGSARDDVPCWYLDPVDGTANFANGVPWTAFSLALVVGGRPVVAVVGDPWREDLFVAEAGQGASLNGEPLQLQPAAESADGDPLRGRIVSTELANQHAWPGMLPMLERLGERFCTLRIMGSGTMTLVGVAAGRGAGAVVGHFGAVDHLAAVLIAAEAGAVVRDEAGQPTWFPPSGGIMVAAPFAADALHAVWSESIHAARGGGPA